MYILNIEKLLFSIMPYIIFILPNIKVIGRLNSIYILLLLFILMFRVNRSDIKKMKIEIISLYLLIIFMILCLIKSTDIIYSFTYFFSVILGFILMIYIGFYASKRIDIEIFIKNMHYLNLIVMIFSLYEIFFKNGIIMNNMEFIDRKNEFGFNYPLVFFTNPNDLAYYLSISIFITFQYFMNKSNCLLKCCIVFLVTIFIILNTNSRLSLIYLIFIFLGTLIILNKNRDFRVFLSIILFMICLLFSYFYIIDIKEYDFFTGRFQLLKGAVEGFYISPIVGLGLGNISNILGNSPHSTIFTFLADMGIIGLSIFLLFYLSLLKKLFNCIDFYKNKADYLKVLYSSNLITLLIFPLLTIVTSSAEQEKITWVILGISMFLIRLEYKVNRNEA